MNKIVWIVLILAGVALLFWLVFGINWRSKQNYDRKHHLLRSRMQAEDTEELRRLLFSNGLTMRVEQRFRPLTMLLARGGRPSVSLSTPQIITSGKDKYNMLMSDLICAKESIHMEYFHFGIDKSSRKIRQVLMEKARQGVKVRFINENIVCDDYLSCVGTTNLDYRSFGIDYEINTFFYDREVALRQKQLFVDDLPICHLLSSAEVRTTPWQRLMRHLAPIV